MDNDGTTVTRMRRHSTALLATTDAVAWVLAVLALALLPVAQQSATGGTVSRALLLGLVAATAHLLLCRVLRLHQGRTRTASLEELLLLGLVTGVVGCLLVATDLAGGWLPVVGTVLATCAALVLMAAARVAWRIAVPGTGPVFRRRLHGTPTVVVGAGEAADELLRSMLRDPASSWSPVALVDDDPRKRYLRLSGVPVLGRIDDLGTLVEATGATAVVVAIPSAPTEVVERVRRGVRGTAAQDQVKVLPSTAQLLDQRPDIRDIRDIDLSDYLGRSRIDTDLAAIAGYLTGRRVLVTGAGGSIGSELCRQIHQFTPAELIMLDRDESALHGVQLDLTRRALLDSANTVLCDIRDEQALRRILLARRPHVVFHAAALKHLPLLEQYPAEAIKTNVWGTLNVLDACEAAGVERFVNISTDKAADPCSVLGTSKRIGERLTADRAARVDGAWLSVRFGNVLGSRGSVLTAFTRQIALGGPVTVTDPDVTRYFMTIEEACQLVVQAAAIGAPGEALVLDMGEPVRILDVARRLIHTSGEDIDVEFTGLRPGEKLHEQLFATGEPRDVRPRHPLVSHVPVPPLDVDAVHRLPTSWSRDDLVTLLDRVSRTPAVRRQGVPATARVLG